jgi:transposase-like protein
VNYFGQHAKSPIEIAQELKPQWSGFLEIDGKPLKISGVEFVVLVAIDAGTHDPFFFQLAEAENEEEAKKFFLIIKEVFTYPVKAIATDFGKGRVFIDLVQKIFPGIPHQTCVIHFSRYVDMRLPKSKKSAYHQQNELLRSSINNILFASNYNDAEELLTRLESIEYLFEAKYHKAIIKSLRRHFKLLTAHFFTPGLPRDTNIVENVIKELGGRLIPMHGFKDPQKAYNFFKLWFCAYRFRPFSNSNYSHRNGRSPLSLAGVVTSGIDWLKFSQRKDNK